MSYLPRARKTNLQLSVERANGGVPLEKLIPAKLNELGFDRAASELGVSQATLNYWVKTLGIQPVRVYLEPGQTIEIKAAPPPAPAQPRQRINPTNW